MTSEFLNIGLTPSRVSKGLLAIPASLRPFFPHTSKSINVFLDNSEKIIEKPFAPFESSTHEARIYGLSGWFRKHRASGGERIIITPVDAANHIYRFNFEDNFLINRQMLEKEFLLAANEPTAEASLVKLANWTGKETENAALLEFWTLSKHAESVRRLRMLERARLSRERVPYSIKVLLRWVYAGHCQICDFTFMGRNGYPYFEIHHLIPDRGHDPKNLLSVCANCHAQFEYARVDLNFGPSGWLKEVVFNENALAVRHILS
jgi:hypothetical protein